jgi:hypothetical protein
MSILARLAVLATLLLLVGCGADAPAASPSPAASPTGEPAASPTAAPSPTLSPVPLPTEPVSPPPATATPAAASPSPTTPATAPPAAWSGPARISERLYDEPALVVDSAGVVHVAAKLDGGIFHVTNASGSWTRERVSRPPRRNSDGQPSIAIDRDGTLWIAYTRLLDTELGRFPLEIHLVNNASGSWSAPRLLADDGANSPSLKVRSGSIYLAWVQGAPSDVIDEEATYPVMFGTDRGGRFTTEQVAANGGFPKLELDADGRPHVIYGSPFWVENGGAGYARASGPDGGFSAESLPAAVGHVRNIALAIDSNGTAHALWSSWPEGAAQPTILHAQRGGSGWSSATAVVDNAWGAAISAGPAGSLHAVAMGEGSGVWYIGNRGGPLSAERLSADVGQQPAIAVDAAGRPHVIFLGGEAGNLAQGMWYAQGPAN